MTTGEELVSAEGLAAAYEMLERARLSHAGFLAEHAARARRLETRSRYVLGSLESARRFLGEDGEATEAPESTEALEAAAQDTRASLERARAELHAWRDEEEGVAAAILDSATSEVEARVAAYLGRYRPRVRVEVSVVAGGRSVVHVVRPVGDDAVLLCATLAGRPPSTYGFLADESTDSVDGQPLLAVAEAGVDPLEVARGGDEAADDVGREARWRLLPIRGHLPVPIPDQEWPRLRLRTRGPVLELEARDEGGRYQHILPEATAELFTGYLVSMQARGRLQVDIDVA